MLMYITTGKYDFNIKDGSSLFIGRDQILCHPNDIKWINGKNRRWDNLTCMSILENGKLYYRYATKTPALFVGAGVLDCLKPSSNPAYSEVHVIEEKILEDGSGFEANENICYIPNKADLFKKVRRLRLGDAIAFAGTMFEKEGRYFPVIQELISLNVFVSLQGLEQSLPFDDKYREIKTETKKEDF